MSTQTILLPWVGVARSEGEAYLAKDIAGNVSRMELYSTYPTRSFGPFM
jgi:hypothetical protein